MYWAKIVIAIGCLGLSVTGVPTTSETFDPSATTASCTSSCDGCAPIKEGVGPLKDLAYQKPGTLPDVKIIENTEPLASKPVRDLKPITASEEKEINSSLILAKRISKRIGNNWKQAARPPAPQPHDRLETLRSLMVFSEIECKFELQPISETGVYLPNLMDALYTVKNILIKYQIRWAIFGGLALKVYGMERDTTDIDILVQTDLTTLRKIFENERRFIMPGPWWSWQDASHVRMYYKYRTYKGAETPVFIEIDFIIAGMMQTPADVTANSISIKKETSDKKNLAVFILKREILFKTKLVALASSDRLLKRAKEIADAAWIIHTTSESSTALMQHDFGHRDFFASKSYMDRDGYLKIDVWSTDPYRVPFRQWIVVHRRSK